MSCSTNPPTVEPVDYKRYKKQIVEDTVFESMYKPTHESLHIVRYLLKKHRERLERAERRRNIGKAIYCIHDSRNDRLQYVYFLREHLVQLHKTRLKQVKSDVDEMFTLIYQEMSKAKKNETVPIGVSLVRCYSSARPIMEKVSTETGIYMAEVAGTLEGIIGRTATIALMEHFKGKFPGVVIPPTPDENGE